MAWLPSSGISDTVTGGLLSFFSDRRKGHTKKDNIGEKMVFLRSCDVSFHGPTCLENGCLEICLNFLLDVSVRGYWMRLDRS